MQPDPISLLAQLGLGQYAAGVLALVMCFGYIVTWLAPLLPAVPPTSYFGLLAYNVVQKIAGNVRNAKNANAPLANTVIKVPTSLPSLFVGMMTATLFGMFITACALTPSQTSSVTSAVTTLATVAAQNNTTAASLVSQGTLICGVLDSTTGQLATAGLVALANVAGVPVSVTGMTSSAVSTACAGLGLVAGALPAAVPAASVPVVTAPTAAALPPVTSVAAP